MSTDYAAIKELCDISYVQYHTPKGTVYDICDQLTEKLCDKLDYFIDVYFIDIFFFCSNIEIMHGTKLCLAFFIVVLMIFIVTTQRCMDNLCCIRDHFSAKYNSRSPQNRRILIEMGRNYYGDLFGGLGYSYGRQVANQGYGAIVVPYADTSLYNNSKVWQLEKMGGSGKNWGNGLEVDFSHGQYKQFPGGDTATWM